MRVLLSPTTSAQVYHRKCCSFLRLNAFVSFLSMTASTCLSHTYKSTPILLGSMSAWWATERGKFVFVGHTALPKVEGTRPEWQGFSFKRTMTQTILAQSRKAEECWGKLKTGIILKPHQIIAVSSTCMYKLNSSGPNTDPWTFFPFYFKIYLLLPLESFSLQIFHSLKGPALPSHSCQLYSRPFIEGLW